MASDSEIDRAFLARIPIFAGLPDRVMDIIAGKLRVVQVVAGAQLLREGEHARSMFVVRDGVLLTPPVSDDILEGVTRRAVVTLARDAGIPVEIRSIDRSELYVCDEVFLCGTGVQMSPVVEVDHRPVGTGSIGPVARLLSERYFAAVRGNLPEYRSWLTTVPA